MAARLLPPTVQPVPLDTSSTQHSGLLFQESAPTTVQLERSTTRPTLQVEDADATTLPALLAKLRSILVCHATEASTSKTAHA